MRILEITLVAVFFTFKTTYGDGILPQTTPATHGAESPPPDPHMKPLPYTTALESIQEPTIVPEFLMFWRSLNEFKKAEPEIINNLTRLVEPTYETYKNDLLNRIQSTIETAEPRSRNPKFTHRTSGFNKTCFERNKSILINKIEDYYNKTAKSLCSKNIDNYLFIFKNSFMPTYHDIMQRIENVKNNTQDIEAFRTYFANIVVTWLLTDSNFSSAAENIQEELRIAGECFNTVNDLLIAYVSEKSSLTDDCGLESEISIQSVVLDQINQEIKQFWDQIHEQISSIKRKTPSISEQISGIVSNVLSQISVNIFSKLNALWKPQKILSWILSTILS